MINDVRISIFPGEKYTPVEADKIITQFGTLLYQKDAKLFSSQGMYATKISYFIPYDNFDPELIQELGWDDPYSQVSTFQSPWIQYSSASTEITGVGLESTNTLIKPSGASPGAADMDARIADAAEDLARFEREGIYESVFKEGKDITNLSPDDPVIKEVKKLLSPEAQALAREQAEYLTQETRKMIDEIKSKYELGESTKFNKKWLTRAAGAAGTALALYELHTIREQYDIRSAWLSYYEDCVRNPDIARFNDPRGDPGFDQANEQIESAREGLLVSSYAMAGASVINGVAGLVAHEPIVDVMTMAASMAEQALMERTIQDEMSGLSKLNSPCRPPPCEETQDDPTSPPPSTPFGDHTPGPDEPGFYYTLGPRESYEPPKGQQCKPLPPNQIRFVINAIVTEEQGNPSYTTTFEATANVTNMLDGAGLEVHGWFQGNGTGYYHSIERYPDFNLYDESKPRECTMETKGDATMKVLVVRNFSGDNLEFAKVDIEIVGDLPISYTVGCLDTYLPTTGSEGLLGSCNFRDVNDQGGHYWNASPEEEPLIWDDCELFMGPLTDVPIARVINEP